MPVQVPLYQQVLEQISNIALPNHIRVTTRRRLALMVIGLVAAKTVVMSGMANELLALGLTAASSRGSIERRLRRTLNDPQLTQQNCYQPVLSSAIEWESVVKDGNRVFVSVDESSEEDEIHLFRVSLSYWGGNVPLAWTIWKQNARLEDGQYWAMVDSVLDRVAALLPEGVEVIVLADRAYDNPPFLDRVSAYGWHFAVRCKANGSLRFKDQHGTEMPLADLVDEKLSHPGSQFKIKGSVYKKAGWRALSVVGVWEAGQDEPMVVLSNLEPSFEVISFYERRFWIETGFRNDKSRGFRWEDSQVKDIAHHERLLVAMAWANLVAMCLGLKEAQERNEALAQRVEKQNRAPKPQPAKESIFTMGLRRVSRWLYGTIKETIVWVLPQIDALSWNCQWFNLQSVLYQSKSVRP